MSWSIATKSFAISSTSGGGKCVSPKSSMIGVSRAPASLQQFVLNLHVLEGLHPLDIIIVIFIYLFIFFLMFFFRSFVF